MFEVIQCHSIDNITECFQTIQFMFKAKLRLLPLSSMRYVTVSDSKRSHDTRKNHCFVIERCRAVIRENTINLLGPRLWDSFPEEVKNTVNLSSLKKALLDFFVVLIYMYNICSRHRYYQPLCLYNFFVFSLRWFAKLLF